MAEVTVALNDALAQDLQRGVATDAEFGQLLTELGLSLKELHPGTTDRELARWFYSTVPESDVDHALERLRSDPRVLAAYVKPPDALP